MRRNFSFLQRLSRLVHFRLVVPIKRSPHPPEYTARGVMVGLFWAFTPLIGVQMYLVFLTWLALRRNPRFDFNLIVGLAWTWTTNVFTVWPVYYAFYVTGQLMMGRLEAATGYGHFVAQWQHVLGDGQGFVATMLAYAKAIAQDQGIAMAIGCVPYAFVSSWLGYRWSLRYLIGRRKARRAALQRRERTKRQQQDAAPSAHPVEPAAAIGDKKSP